MAREFHLPDVGKGLTAAKIVRWLVSVGDDVVVNQPLAEVETANSVVTELPSPCSGTVLHLGGPGGVVLAVGDLVVALGDRGESWPTSASAGRRPGPAVPTADHAAGSLDKEAQDLVPLAPRVRAQPLVRMLAKDHVVNLRTVRGTGPQGMITADDVKAAARASRPAAPSRPGELRRPLSATRRIVAANLAWAWSQIPMVSAFDDIDATHLLSARDAFAERYGRPVPLDALLVAAVLPVLRAFPEFNATLDGDALVLHSRHDIGLAVDTPDGQMVGVVADASAKNLAELIDEVVRLGQSARARRLSVEEMTAQTFTLSNVGAVGGRGHSTPLVPPGTTAIVSVGRATHKPVVRDGQIGIAQLMPVSLSYDHRVIDGAMGQCFLTMLARVLAEPTQLLM